MVSLNCFLKSNAVVAQLVEHAHGYRTIAHCLGNETVNPELRLIS
ncbi:MAG: hypothetical protein JWM92_354 [Candidatus Nomurabacteria bacterium]|nr:hypothetical protein [Candidatus Nomurabacteria bacterium]